MKRNTFHNVVWPQVEQLKYGDTLFDPVVDFSTYLLVTTSIFFSFFLVYNFAGQGRELTIVY